VFRGDERNDRVLFRHGGLEGFHARAIGGVTLLLAAGRASIGQRGTQMLKGLALPEVEQRRLDLVLITEIGHGHVINEVPAEHRRLILGREGSWVSPMPS
jgi:hypothetical protein